MQASVVQQVLDVSGADVRPCYQCTRCSVGCPVAERMDFKPNQVIRMLQYGRKDELSKSEAIWLCVGCQTCTARCPNKVDVAGVMDALRNLAIREGVAPAVPDAAAFHREFLGAVRRKGRIHELSFVGRFKLATWNLFKDMALGWKMFVRGKLPLWVRGVKGRREIKNIFKER